MPSDIDAMKNKIYNKIMKKIFRKLAGVFIILCSLGNAMAVRADYCSELHQKLMEESKRTDEAIINKRIKIKCPYHSSDDGAKGESKNTNKANSDGSKLSASPVQPGQTQKIQTESYPSGNGGPRTRYYSSSSGSGSSSENSVSSGSSSLTDYNPNLPLPSGDLLFVGDFETGNLSQWWRSQSAPNAVTVRSDIVRSGNFAAKFSVTDNDTAANYSNIPNSDPRAQLIPGYLFRENDDVYISLSTFFPSDFPLITNWMVIFGIHGEPYNGPSTFNLGVTRDRIYLNSRESEPVWTSPLIQKGVKWEDLVLHIRFSPDPNVGFVEVWHDGVKQVLKNGDTRYYYATLRKGINWTGPGGHLEAGLTQYRSASERFGTVVLYHDNFRIGRTYESVAITD